MKHIFSFLLLLALFFGFVNGACATDTAALLPNAEQQFVDANGAPYAGGHVYFYVPSTTTPKNTWQDPAETILNTNPVTLDSAGRAIIYGQGSYRQILFDASGNEVWDQLTTSIAQTNQATASTGSADAYVVTYSSPPGSLQVGAYYPFIANFQNTTTTPTENVNSLGAKTITKGGTNALSAGDICNGQVVVTVYDGTRLQMVSPTCGAGSGSVTASAFIPTGNSAPTNGLYLPTANQPGISANSHEVANFQSNGSAVNYLNFTSAATGNPAQISAVGSDTNVGIDLATQGTGSFLFRTGGNSYQQLQVTDTTSAVDYVSITGGVTGSPGTVTISAAGSDSNINLNLLSKGSGTVQLNGSSLLGSYSIGANGYVKLPSWLAGGLIIEWGSASCTATVTFPLTFPNSVFSVAGSAATPSGGGYMRIDGTVSTSGFTMGCGAAGTTTNYYVALGD